MSQLDDMSMTYPSTRVMHTLYADPGDTSGIGDTISRVTAIAGASTRGGSDANVLAAYYYNGMGRMVLKDLPQPDVRLDYFGGSTGTYAGFDRFGRIIDHLWRDYGASADRERFKHGYDRNSNRTYRDHTNTTTRDGFYTYDGLNRLTDYDRGDLNGTFSAVGTLSFAQKWDLKALGNWTAFKEDANGNGSFTEAGDLNQTRTHNAANEITGISETGDRRKRDSSEFLDLRSHNSELSRFLDLVDTLRTPAFRQRAVDESDDGEAWLARADGAGAAAEGTAKSEIIQSCPVFWLRWSCRCIDRSIGRRGRGRCREHRDVWREPSPS